MTILWPVENLWSIETNALTNVAYLHPRGPSPHSMKLLHTCPVSGPLANIILVNYCELYRMPSPIELSICPHQIQQLLSLKRKTSLGFYLQVRPGASKVDNTNVVTIPYSDENWIRAPDHVWMVQNLEKDHMWIEYTAGWWFGTFFIFPYIGNFIIPIDFHIFQRGGPTTNQLVSVEFICSLCSFFWETIGDIL